jgi:hypothetical protein
MKKKLRKNPLEKGREADDTKADTREEEHTNQKIQHNTETVLA